MNNFSFDIYKKISPDEREDWHLYIDAVYCANPKEKTMSAEVLSKLLGVKNQGGFRYRGKTSEPYLVVLFTTGEDIYWRDEVDNSMGVLLYYGDNRTPGTDLHKTNLHGNEILRYIFELASSNNIDVRKKIPPILVFKKDNVKSNRDVKFLGLAVPGIKGQEPREWLIAVWGQNREGDRFQNYRAFFTMLNISSGSEKDSVSGINLAWLNDIEQNQAFESEYAPKEWKKYIAAKRYSALITKQEKYERIKDEQMPQSKLHQEMLRQLQSYFIQKDKGYSFEQFAADIVQQMDSRIIDVVTTRPFKDGGFDAEGKYKIFDKVENSILVDFYLQAKCYTASNSVGVKDTSRLISRIKNKQFGIMITTSYIASQAYKEILEDGHPIVLITGKDIVNHVYNKLELTTVGELKEWLKRRY